MKMKYICDIYTFWPQKYISASFKYTYKNHEWEPWYVDRTKRKQNLSGSRFLDRAESKQYEITKYENSKLNFKIEIGN